MSIERIAVSLGELGQLVNNVGEVSLQKQLKTHTDAMLRNIFDHCTRKNRLDISSKDPSKSISSSTNQKSEPPVPSLADPAIKKMNPYKSIF